MKRFLSIILVLTTLVCAAFAATGCSDKMTYDSLNGDWEAIHHLSYNVKGYSVYDEWEYLEKDYKLGYKTDNGWSYVYSFNTEENTVKLGFDGEFYEIPFKTVSYEKLEDTYKDADGPYRVVSDKYPQIRFHGTPSSFVEYGTGLTFVALGENVMVYTGGTYTNAETEEEVYSDSNTGMGDVILRKSGTEIADFYPGVVSVNVANGSLFDVNLESVVGEYTIKYSTRSEHNTPFCDDIENNEFKIEKTADGYKVHGFKTEARVGSVYVGADGVLTLAVYMNDLRTSFGEAKTPTLLYIYETGENHVAFSVNGRGCLAERNSAEA